MLKVEPFDQEFIVQVDNDSSGFGKQIFTGVTVIHLESKLKCHCALYRSTHKNKNAAILAIQAKLLTDKESTEQ